MVKIEFDLSPYTDGEWPPGHDELLWASPIGGESYRIENVPFYVRNLANQDIDVRQFEDVAEERAHVFRVLTIEDRVNAGYLGVASFEISSSV
jgi:hypothetical protein